jgi:hypothetical protein
MKSTLRPHRRQAARTGPGISLFPFLAVLICTMGALVPLLLAMTQVARHQAEAEAVAKAAEAAAQHEVELRTAREDVGWRIEQLKKCRKQTETQLADARLDLGHIEDHSRRLRSQLERYENTIRELEGIENASHEKQGQSATELERVRGQIAAMQRRVGEARQAAANRNQCYAVVPYEGPNQTRRRPIYLECCADAVVLQPEGIRLTADDFRGPMGAGNPLAAALRAARERLLAQQQFDPQAGEPYPMLLVRPDGIGAYYAAREAMKSWGCDFGYELVNDDWKLAYPQPDPRLAEDIRQALDTARITQARLIAAAPREYGRAPKTVYKASRNGGFVPTDDPGDDDGGYRSATAAGHVGRNAGGYSGPGGYSGRGGSAGGGHRADGGGNYGSPGSAYNPYTTVAQAPGATAGASAAGSGLTAMGTGAAPGSSGSGTGSMLASPGGNSLAGGQPGGTGVGVGGASGSVGPYAGTGGGGGLPSGSSGGMASSGTPGGAAGGVPGGVGVAGGGSSSGAANCPYNPARANAGGTSAANPYVTTPDGAGTPDSNSNAAGGPSLTMDATRGSQGSGSDQPYQRPEGYVVGQPQREAPSQPTRSKSTSDPPSDEMVQRQPLRPGEWQPRPDPPPKRPDDKDKKDEDRFGRKRPRERSLAERRGEDWGLRDAARGSVGVTRPIRIDCYADRLVVLSERSPSENKEIKLGRRTSASIDTLISEIWVHIESWGIAGRGMYWKPVLQIAVAPDAEDRFADLTTLLDGSGMTVKRRQ